MTEQEYRVAIVQEALSWINTPFHHHACVKGAGVDCLHFLYAPYREVGLIPDIEIPQYSEQWFAHRYEQRLIEAITNTGAVEVTDPSYIPKPADVVTARVGRVYAHSAIVVEWPMIVHASPDRESVQIDNADVYSLFSAPQHRPLKIFTMWPEKQ